jgi:(2Fe-2S) ferredoxin
MYIYNVTVNINHDIQHEWLNWMQEKHMPDVLSTGCFVDCQILKVLFVEDEGHTYSVQYRFLDMEDIERYQKNFAQALQNEHKIKFEGKYAAFRTILEIL